MTQESIQAEFLRVFIAIDPNEILLKKIIHTIEHLKEQTDGKKVKWVKPQNLHLTLRFLAQLNSNKLEDLKKLVAIAVESQTVFHIHLNKIFVFPSRHPKVVALSAELSDELATLVKNIEESMQQLGFEPENRAFLPHITLGRTSTHVEFDYTNIPLALPLPLEVSEIILYRSELNSAGSIYTPLHRFNLRPYRSLDEIQGS